MLWHVGDGRPGRVRGAGAGCVWGGGQLGGEDNDGDTPAHARRSYTSDVWGLILMCVVLRFVTINLTALVLKPYSKKP